MTFTQTQNIWHDDTNDHDDPEALTTAAAGDLTLTQTVTDADGDTDSASINLGAGVFVIQDDGPDAVVIGTPAAIVLDESPLGEDSADGVARWVLLGDRGLLGRTLRRRTLAPMVLAARPMRWF